MPARLKAQAEFDRLRSIDSDECALWPFAKDSSGYGNMKYYGRAISVHRLSCHLSHGPPPTSTHQAAHYCRNRHCINPRHLRWATHAENQRDRIKDGTSMRGRRSTLTADDVIKIRRMRKEGVAPIDIAHRFGISRRSVYSVTNGDRWSWLHDPVIDSEA